MLFICLLAGCSKKNDTVAAKDTAAPTIKILGPGALQYYKTGDPLCLTATIFDEGVISYATVKIVKDGQAAPLLQYDYKVNDRTFELDKKIIVPATFTGNCSLVIEAADTFGNKGMAAVGFSSN
jgi:hypothetical protein